MNLRPIGFARILRGLREGDQMVLLTGLALIALQALRNSRGKRELIYRKKLPVGTTLVLRHARPGSAKLQIFERLEP